MKCSLAQCICSQPCNKLPYINMPTVRHTHTQIMTDNVQPKIQPLSVNYYSTNILHSQMISLCILQWQVSASSKIKLFATFLQNSPYHKITMKLTKSCHFSYILFLRYLHIISRSLSQKHQSFQWRELGNACTPHSEDSHGQESHTHAFVNWRCLCYVIWTLVPA